VYLDNVSVSGELSTLSHTDVLFTGVSSETPLETLKNLLPSSKLKFTTTDGLNNVSLVVILGPHGKQDLSNINTSGNTNRLSVRVTHT